MNVLNSEPSTSILQIASGLGYNVGMITLENILAAIMVKFEQYHLELLDHLLNESNRNPFDPFLDRYYKRWLHKNQIVRIETSLDEIQEARIVGINEFGLLRAIPTRGGSEIQLLPDGNSFDMMIGLISAKK